MKIIVFGIGKYYLNRKEQLKKILSGDEIVAFIDNKVKKKEYYGNLQLLPPRDVGGVKFDYILLMSSKTVDMEKQLIELGVGQNKILRFNEYVSYKNRGKIKLYIQNVPLCKKKKVLIITTVADYNGGSLVAFYAAKALQAKGYDAWLMTPKISPNLFKEMGGQAINVAVCPSLPFVSTLEMYWIQQFDVIIVNVFQMIATVAALSKCKPTVWWLHEPSEKYDKVYTSALDLYSKYTNPKYFQRAHIVAVSNIAKRNFEYYYPCRVDSILPYGIPDEVGGIDKCEEDKVIFAIIGSFSEIKAQHIFIEAAKSVIDDCSQEVEFWLIGYYGTDDYSEKIKCIVRKIPEIKLIGSLTRKELKEKFDEIDVVVCTSLEETMSLTVTEGLMHGKVCITSDATGIADYIVDGKNGFICKAGDVDSTYEKMKYVLMHKGELSELRRCARQTYEENFTLDSFAKRLESEIKMCINKF